MFEGLSHAMLNLKVNIKYCSVCGGISDSEICAVCSDDSRDRSLLCIVEEAKDLLTIENTGSYKGLFHVLGGVISPLDGIGPDDLNMAGLLNRCKENNINEIIIALNPTIEGDATAMYIAKIMQPLGIKISRIAHGLPVGADLEFTDNATIVKSIEGRVEI